MDHGGITGAAAVLFISRPSLSQAIRGRERESKVCACSIGWAAGSSSARPTAGAA
ncbi:MAG TPA: LysR family transcriptional regulator [Streptosporangiaceae bacterium]|nr:LysR family transcriptional regulator [Streptosporangiaceae bacterium]